MKIVMRQGATDEQIETIEAHLRAFGSHFSVSRDPSGVAIHADNNSLGLYISIGKMPGIAKIERRSSFPRFIGNDLREFLADIHVEPTPFRFFGLDMLDGCPRRKEIHPPHKHPNEERFCLGKGGPASKDAILFIVVEERPTACERPGDAKGFFFYVSQAMVQPSFAGKVLQEVASA